MADSLASVKKQLQDFGISTVTPGLAGEERHEELIYRLDVARKKLSGKLSNKFTEDVIDKNLNYGPVLHDHNSMQENIGVGSLASLEFSEIRARLVALGESTSTPGLVGEDRKNELLRRLIQSICGPEELDTFESPRQFEVC